MELHFFRKNNKKQIKKNDLSLLNSKLQVLRKNKILNKRVYLLLLPKQTL